MSESATPAAHDSLSVFDLSDRVQIELRGPDRLTFLHNFCTNDVKRLQPGEGCEAFLTNIKGRILGHISASVTEDALWIDSVPGTGEFLVGHLDKYLITEDVQIIDHTAEIGPLCLVGPLTVDWLKERAVDVGNLPLWAQQSASLDSIDVLIRRVGFTLPAAFELVVPHADRPRLHETITTTGVASGSREVFDALRIEAGFPHYGIDLTDAHIAQEAGRTAQAISFTKGCYLGQEPIARLDALGHTNKELRCLKLSAGPLPDRGTTVRSTAGDDVGQITSAALSPDLEFPVALAMLKAAFLTPETDVVVGGTSATVLPLGGQSV